MPTEERVSVLRVRDAIIVGSGPAGYSAAIYAARAGLDTLLVAGDMDGGALMVAGHLDNYPGFARPVYGPGLAHEMRIQAQRCGAEVQLGDVDELLLAGAIKSVSVNGTHHYAKSLILTMGAVNRSLGVPGERELTGRGVCTSAKSHGGRFTDREVAVVGGGDAATEEALFVATLARRVILVHRRRLLRASTATVVQLRSQPNIVVEENAEVLAVQGKDHVTGLRMRHVDTAAECDVRADAVVVAIGQRPRSDLLAGQVDLDARGYVQTRDQSTHTCVDGVFAAGDLIDGRYRQAVTAAATGCRAALDARRWIDQCRSVTSSIAGPCSAR